MYGILKSSTNTGSDNELLCHFVAPLSVISNDPSFNADTLSLRSLSVSQGVQRWEITANINPENNSGNFFLHNIRNGKSNPFYVRMPQVYRPDSAKTPKNRTILTDGVISSGATTFNVDGLSGANLAEGEFVAFSGHDKVYLIIDSGTNGVGVQVYPAIVDNIADNTQLLYGEQVSLKVKYSPDLIMGIKYVDGILSDPGSITLIEKL